jgi:hypothetical protein
LKIEVVDIVDSSGNIKVGVHQFAVRYYINNYQYDFEKNELNFNSLINIVFFILNKIIFIQSSLFF